MCCVFCREWVAGIARPSADASKGSEILKSERERARAREREREREREKEIDRDR
jgi:hypothetical protein